MSEETKTLTAERDELRKDKERLDWLDSDEGSIQPVLRQIRKHGESAKSLTFRQAIDAAMQQKEGK